MNDASILAKMVLGSEYVLWGSLIGYLRPGS